MRPFQDVDAGRWQLSNAGGRQPIWAPNGSELFYFDGEGFLVGVSVQTAPIFSAGRPKTMFEVRYVGGRARSYDVSPDGRRFLMMKPATQPDTEDVPVRIIVVLNWADEVKRLVPTGN